MSFQAISCSFGPLLTLKIKILKKCKKTPGDIILLHMCTINQDHMHSWYGGSWDMKFKRQNHSELFCKFQNRKKTMEISSFYARVQKIMIIRYTVPEMCREMDVIVIFHFGKVSPFWSPTAQKMKMSKKFKKSTLRYHHLAQVYQKSWSYATLLLGYGTYQM